MRLTSPCLFEAAAAGIMEGGCNVLDIGMLSAPAAEWAARHLNADGLVVITASHNPPQWNALKFVDSKGVAISRERGAEITSFIGKPHLPPLEWFELGKIYKIGNIISDYQSAVLSFCNRRIISKRIKVIADSGNGTAIIAAPAIFRSLGIKAKFINSTLDGRFPNRPSEPSKSNLGELIKSVVEQDADLGIAWDGDADRVTFVDDRGRWISGDVGVALSARWALICAGYKQGSKKSSKKAPIVVTTSATSRVVEEVAKEHGAKCVYTDVGAPYLSQKIFLLGSDVILGGEEVGGIIWPKFSLAKDGVLASIKLIEMISKKPLSEWVDELPKFYTCKLKVECPLGINKRVVLALQSKISPSLPAGSTFLPLYGGFRLDFPQGWVLVRASGTENQIRIFAESKSMQEAEELAKLYHSIAKKELESGKY
jgi:phosphomannomutase/phosphoglucomutase